MRERHLLALTAVPFVVAALWPGVASSDAVAGNEVTRFADPAIVESSGLAVVDGLLVTTNDSGDRGRVFAVDPSTGRTVGVTQWAAEPEDVEALAPAGEGELWVGDIGDNGADRGHVTVARIPVGSGDRDVDPVTYDLVYPDGARDAESLLVDPRNGRLYVVSKGVLGGTVFEAPARLSPDRPNRLTEVGAALAVATDAAFFPDGRHLIVRNYTMAAVYTWPELTPVGRFGLPAQRQGEGIAVAPDGTILASSEGLHAPVLRISLPADVRAAIATESPSSPATPSATQAPTTTTPANGSVVSTGEAEATPQRSVWPWALGGIVGLGMVLVLVLSVRPR